MPFAISAPPAACTSATGLTFSVRPRARWRSFGGETPVLTATAMRALFLLHRWLGIALGVLVSAWCLSGFVMMYVRYPALTQEEALAGLAPLDFAPCCAPGPSALAGYGAIDAFRIEMLAGEAVVRIESPDGRTAALSLSTGQVIAPIDAEIAETAALGFLRRSGIAHRITDAARIHDDQWTVSGSFDRHRPLYRFNAGDSLDTEIYVSGRSGEIVQQSNGRERLWNWFGAVTHWIYPTVLRRHPAAWHYTVVLTSAIGLFLIATGIWIGCRQLHARRNCRRSPYRGIALWHHYGGLFFGLLALTWTFSGLMSMDPFRMAGGNRDEAERRLIAGVDLDGRRLAEVLRGLKNARLAPDTVRIESAPFDEQLALLAWQSSGSFVRLLAPSMRIAPLSTPQLRKAAELLVPERHLPVSAALIDQPDRYYFGHHQNVQLPVYRVVSGDSEATRYYVHPETGQLLLEIDGAARWYRWLFEALHRGDFAQLVRTRPVWDIFMLALLTGVTFLALTGTYMGIIRLRRSDRSVRRLGRPLGKVRVPPH